MRAKYGIDPTGGKLDQKAIGQWPEEEQLRILVGKKFKWDMQDHTIADERLNELTIEFKLMICTAAIAAGRALLPRQSCMHYRGGSITEVPW